MKIATQAKGEAARGFLPKLFQRGLVRAAVVCIVVIRMGRAHDMSDAILDCHLAHGRGHLPRTGAVVDGRQKVAVDVDHDRHILPKWLRSELLWKTLALCCNYLIAAPERIKYSRVSCSGISSCGYTMNIPESVSTCRQGELYVEIDQTG